MEFLRTGNPLALVVVAQNTPLYRYPTMTQSGVLFSLLFALGIQRLTGSHRAAGQAQEVIPGPLHRSQSSSDRHLRNVKRLGCVVSSLDPEQAAPSAPGKRVYRVRSAALVNRPWNQESMADCNGGIGGVFFVKGNGAQGIGALRRGDKTWQSCRNPQGPVGAAAPSSQRFAVPS
ncbi:hypothetical protein VTN02DRAFT_243 [Thermoascus thermophilus]